MVKYFKGAGGGGSSPTNEPDNLKSEDIIEIALAVSEGPIRGLTNGAKSFYIGDTPLVSAAGVTNFDKFAIGVHPGYPEGSAAPLSLHLGGQSSNSVVGVNLFKSVPVVRQTDSVLRGKINVLKVRINFMRLMHVDDDGSTKNNTAEFMIEYKPSTASDWLPFDSTRTTISLEGKTSSNYLRDFRVSVPTLSGDDWMIRVTKISNDSDTHNIVDLMWDSFQEITIGQVAYPNTAIIHALGVATGQFSSIPEFGGVFDGIMVRVPTNYNPDLRTYDESTPWDGSFKLAWTNNPAWILYDLIVSTRYGLMAHRLYVDVNRFDFYLAGKWCDELVLVGSGPATQPRYTYNDNITEVRPAMEMLNYVAGSFNAIVWDDLAGKIHLTVDKDDPAVMLFTTESITAEGFNYTFTDMTARANDISVSFINPDLDWNTDRRRIPNVTTAEDAIAKFGRIPLDFIAAGCTDVNEAVRKAQVRLISAQTETTMCSFTTTRLGALLSMFDVILIADATMGWSQSGRLTHYDSEFIYFRDQIYMETTEEYNLQLQTATGLVQVSVQAESIGPTNRLKLMSAMPTYVPRYASFTLERAGEFGFAKPFRVLSIKEVDGSPYQFEISCVEINRNKYSQSNDYSDLSEIQYSYKIPSLPGAPERFTAVSGTNYVLIDSTTGVVTSRIYASWMKPFGAVVSSYVFEWKHKDVDSDWNHIQTDSEYAYISPVVPLDHYSLRVAAIDHNGHRSAWTVIDDYQVEGRSVVPQNVASFSAVGGIFQNFLSWTFGAAKDVRKVEIWGSTSNVLSSATKLSDLSYPTASWTHMGLDVAVTIYYWIRLQDTSGNFSLFSNSISATTSDDATAILAILEGKIGASQLLDDLNSRINLIDDPSTVEGSVANLINQEVQDRIAAITNEASIRATAILNEAAARDAAVQSESLSRVTSDAAIAQSVTTLAAKVDTNTASITNESTVRSTADSSFTSQLSALNSTVNANSAAITNEASTRSTNDNALTLQFNNLQSTVNGNIAAITNEASTRASADSATSAQLTTLTSSVNSNNAAIYNESVTRSTADSSLSTQVSTLTSTVNGNTASITNTATAVNGLYAQQYIKTDVNGHIAGYGLANTGVTSSFIVNADIFAFALPGQTSKFPFIAGLVNGVQTVGINGALVIDGTLVVKRANIGIAEVDTLRLAGNAVTLNMFTSGNALDLENFASGQPIRQIASITGVFPDAAAIAFEAVWQAGTPGSGTQTYVEIHCDSTVVMSWSDSVYGGQMDSHVAGGHYNVTAGTHTFTLWFGNDWSSNSWNLRQWTFSVFGTMR